VALFSRRKGGQLAGCAFRMSTWGRVCLTGRCALHAFPHRQFARAQFVPCSQRRPWRQSLWRQRFVVHNLPRSSRRIRGKDWRHQGAGEVIILCVFNILYSSAFAVCTVRGTFRAAVCAARVMVRYPVHSCLCKRIEKRIRIGFKAHITHGYPRWDIKP